MNIIISPPPLIIASHRLFSHTTTFRHTPPPPNQHFHFFRGDVKFANIRNKAFYKGNNKDTLQHSELQFVDELHEIKKYVKSIKSIFNSIDDGAITPSAYDTAWVALIENANGPNGGPQFPSSLQWVVDHQLPDGSWGEPLMFSAPDRILNTLACVITLTYWNIHPDKCEKGTNFVAENINKLGDEKEEHMTIGFEIVFPSLIEVARKLKIKVPEDAPVLKEINARRDMKLRKIPKEKFHNTPTSLLYSLEGMRDLEWEKLLKHRCDGGSFLFSPAATAFGFMQTKDQDCLAYITSLVSKFNGGVPNVYPVDMFEHIWIVDRLQRLGIARFFPSEIKNCVNYIYRYWDEQGIGFARNSNRPDIDDTAMAFRLLRTNGYQVSPDVFLHFEENGHFMGIPGQSIQAVTAMFNLYRASQVLFPGEKILDVTKKYSHKVLIEKQSSNELFDKWVIPKDLPGEVGYALDVPWYASLPRLEARVYLEQYGGDDDVWIGKSLYRMRYVNNNKYLEMAKLDYNRCQAIHQLEWSHIQKWYAHLNIEENLNPKLLWSYYEAAASIFEPERCNERISWAKTNVLLNTITSLFTEPKFSNADMQVFVNEFTNTDHPNKNGKSCHVVMDALHETLNQISSEARAAHGVDIYPHLHSVWTEWLLNWIKGVSVANGEGELIVTTITMSNGRWLPEDALNHPQYRRLSSLQNEICHQISHKGDHTISYEMESKMQELVQLVLCDTLDDLDHDLKQTFLTVAKTFYYKAYFDDETKNRHIRKVLFENVV